MILYRDLTLTLTSKNAFKFALYQLGLLPLHHNAMIESLLYPEWLRYNAVFMRGWAVTSQCYDWKPSLSYSSNLHCTDSSGYVTMLCSWGAQTWAVTSQCYDWKPPLSYPSKFALYWLEWLRYNAVFTRGPDLSRYVTMLWLKASFILSIKFALYWLEWLRYNAVIMRGPDLSRYVTILCLKASFILSNKMCTVLTWVVTLQCCDHEGPRLEPLRHNAMIESLLYPIYQICITSPLTQCHYFVQNQPIRNIPSLLDGPYFIKCL